MNKNLFPRLASFALFIICGFSACEKTNMTGIHVPPAGDSSIMVYLPAIGNKTAHDYLFSSICIDKNNNKWLLGSDGIYKFDGANWTTFNATNTPALSYFNAGDIFCGNDGTIFIVGGYTKTGVNPISTLVIYKEGVWTAFTLPFDPTSCQIDRSRGELFILSRYEKDRNINRVFKYSGTGSFSDSASYTFVDCGDYNAKSFYVFNDKLFISYNQVEYGYPVDSNNFGIMVQSLNGSRTISNYPDSTLKMEFYNMASADGNQIFMFGLTNWWVQLGTTLVNNLFYFDGSTWSSVPIPPSVTINFRAKVSYTKDGTLWLSSGNGITRFNNQHFTNYPINIPYQGSVSDFKIDDNGIIWIASWNTGLIKFIVH